MSLLAALAAAAIGAGIAAVLLLREDDGPGGGKPRAALYVDPDSRGGRCSDDREPLAARSPSSPWCTLQRAIEAAPSGATVLLRHATYPAVSIDRRGLRLRAFRGERAVLPGVEVARGGVRLERLNITGTVRLLPGATRVALVGNRWITDGRSGGTNLDIGAGVRNVLVKANRISQRGELAGANAINFSSTDQQPPIRNVTLRDNTIGPISGGGDVIQAKNTRSLVVEANEIFGVTRPPASGAHPDALQSIYGARGLVLRRNFIHDIAAQGIFVQEFRGENAGVRVVDNVITRVASPWTALGITADNVVLEHNTIDGKARVGPGAGAVVLANIASGSLTIDPGAEVRRQEYNLVSRLAGPPGVGSIIGLPSFRNSAGDDFRLVPGTLGDGVAPGGLSVGARAADLSNR